MPVLCDITTLPVGGRVWFQEERLSYTVQARDDRFIVCTKPFAARRTVLYTIVDLQEQVRGPDDRLFCQGYESREDCERALRQLNASDDDEDVAIGISHRHRVPLRIAKAEAP